MSKNPDLLTALSEAVILLLDHAVHRPSLDRHNLVRTRLNQAVQADNKRREQREKRDGPR